MREKEVKNQQAIREGVPLIARGGTHKHSILITRNCQSDQGLEAAGQDSHGLQTFI